MSQNIVVRFYAADHSPIHTTSVVLEALRGAFVVDGKVDERPGEGVLRAEGYGGSWEGIKDAVEATGAEGSLCYANLDSGEEEREEIVRDVPRENTKELLEELSRHLTAIEVDAYGEAKWMAFGPNEVYARVQIELKWRVEQPGWVCEEYDPGIGRCKWGEHEAALKRNDCTVDGIFTGKEGGTSWVAVDTFWKVLVFRYGKRKLEVMVRWPAEKAEE